MQIDLHKPILDKNDRLADENRELFREKKVFVLDLLASPGSGKTSTILATIEALRDRCERIVGKPEPIKYKDRIVGVVMYRDNTVIDVIHQIDEE